jgi:hypothetical protein
VETGDPGALTANAWQWASFTDPLQQFEVGMPESYLRTFDEDTLGASGTVAIVADCNNASGSYTEGGGGLTIEVGPMTMAARPIRAASSLSSIWALPLVASLRTRCCTSTCSPMAARWPLRPPAGEAQARRPFWSS